MADKKRRLQVKKPGSASRKKKQDSAAPPAPDVKWEPGPDDEIKPGEIDAMGNYFMEELDFLRLQSRKERRNNCKAQGEALRLKAELTQLRMAPEVNRLLNQAAAMDRAAALHEQIIDDQLTELSKKYDIDFKDPTVVIDDEMGKIIATDVTKGLPRLSQPSGVEATAVGLPGLKPQSNT